MNSFKRSASFSDRLGTLKPGSHGRRRSMVDGTSYLTRSSEDGRSESRGNRGYSVRSTRKHVYHGGGRVRVARSVRRAAAWNTELFVARYKFGEDYEGWADPGPRVHAVDHSPWNRVPCSHVGGHRRFHAL